MPWKETTPVAERMGFLVDYRTGLFTVSFLAERHGVSRKTLSTTVAREPNEREGKLYAAVYAHRPWHRGGRADRAARDSEPGPFRDFHRATTTR